MLLEGGSIHVDGDGTLITTKQCLLNPNRNPHLSREDIEVVLKKTLGVSKIIWFPVGIDGDNDTDGHVDNLGCFVRPGHVVLSWTDDLVNDGMNYATCRQAHYNLSKATDAKNRPITVTKLYLPSPALYYTKDEAESLATVVESTGDDGAVVMKKAYTRAPGEKIAASYFNSYIANDAVLVPQFGPDCEETDRKAISTLETVFMGWDEFFRKGRKLIGVHSREILLGGGNIHCQTQQVPSSSLKSSATTGLSSVFPPAEPILYLHLDNAHSPFQQYTNRSVEEYLR